MSRKQPNPPTPPLASKPPPPPPPPQPIKEKQQKAVFKSDAYAALLKECTVIMVKAAKHAKLTVNPETVEKWVQEVRDELAYIMREESKEAARLEQ